MLIMMKWGTIFYSFIITSDCAAAVLHKVAARRWKRSKTDVRSGRNHAETNFSRVDEGSWRSVCVTRRQFPEESFTTAPLLIHWQLF